MNLIHTFGIKEKFVTGKSSSVQSNQPNDPIIRDHN
jgi:hypothetical protein